MSEERGDRAVESIGSTFMATVWSSSFGKYGRETMWMATGRCFSWSSTRRVECDPSPSAPQREEPLQQFQKNKRSLGRLLENVVYKEVTFVVRHGQWAMEQKVDAESVIYVVHDLVGSAIEVGATYDQLDLVNLASFELVGASTT